MEATMASTTRLPPPLRHRSIPPSATFSLSPSSLLSSFRSSFPGRSVAGDYAGPKLCSKSLSWKSRRGAGFVTMVRTSVRNVQAPPPSSLEELLQGERIIFIGLPFVSLVTECILHQLVTFHGSDPERPIYMYINSTGATKGYTKFGPETDALAIYDIMSVIRPPIYTLCVGHAWAEASLILAAGVKGHRAALPSATIMMRQPINWFRGQATSLDIHRTEMSTVKAIFVKLYAEHTGQTPELIEADIMHPKYFSAEEAVEYGIIDRVLPTNRSHVDEGIVSQLKKSKLI